MNRRPHLSTSSEQKIIYLLQSRILWTSCTFVGREPVPPTGATAANSRVKRSRHDSYPTPPLWRRCLSRTCARSWCARRRRKPISAINCSPDPEPDKRRRVGEANFGFLLLARAWAGVANHDPLLFYKHQKNKNRAYCRELRNSVGQGISPKMWRKRLSEIYRRVTSSGSRIFWHHSKQKTSSFANGIRVNQKVI